MDAVKIFTGFFQKFSRIGPVSKKADSIEYEEVIFDEFGLTIVQRKKGTFLILLTYLLLLNTVFLFFSLSLKYILPFWFIALLLYNKSFNLHENSIKDRESSLVNYYMLLNLQIQILLHSISELEDKNTFLIDLLAEGPLIASNQSHILSTINLGGGFKLYFGKLVFYSPAFQKFFRNLIKFDYNLEILEHIGDFESFYENQARIFTNSLESRTQIFFFFSLFYPIGYIFISSLSSFSLYNTLVATLVFFILQKYFTQIFLKNQVNLFGGVNNQNSTEKQVFLAFLRFFNTLSHHLVLFSPEYAIYSSIQSINSTDLKLLNLSSLNLSVEFISLDYFLEKFFKTISNNQVKVFLRFLTRIFRTNSYDGPKLFSEISHLIKQHMDIMNDQEMFFQSFKIKITISKVLLSFILGVLTPFIFRFQYIYSNLGYILNGIDEDSLDFNRIYFLLMGIISLIFLEITIVSFNELYGKPPFSFRDIFCILLYIVVFAITNSLLGNFIGFG